MIRIPYRPGKTGPRLFYLIGAILAAIVLAGCLAASAATPTPGPPSPTATSDRPADSGEPVFFGYTYQQPDGNRVVAGRGRVPEATPVDIPLAGPPLWLAAAPFENGSLWAAVLADGRVEAFRLEAGQWQAAAITPEQLPAGMPPVLEVKGSQATLLNPPMNAPSLLTHPVVVTGTDRLALVHGGGQVMFLEETDVIGLEVNALLDARLLQDEAGRLLLLTEPTTRYGHGVLGDKLEAAGIRLIESTGSPTVTLTISIPAPDVIEGIAPIWTDLSGDGQREIIVTLSNADRGARIVVFNESGEQVAAGPAIGQGFRWRHQVAVAPFGPNGEVELVDVLTPHIGGTVEFYQLDGDELQIVAQIPGYTSHVSGSRNLDMAAGGDFDGDGRLEVLLPNQARTMLGAIRRTEDGAEVAWTAPVDGKITTNLAAVTLPEGQMAVGVGRADGSLRIWPAE